MQSSRVAVMDVKFRLGCGYICHCVGVIDDVVNIVVCRRTWSMDSRVARASLRARIWK
jgi:hypothetical protein